MFVCVCMCVRTRDLHGINLCELNLLTCSQKYQFRILFFQSKVCFTLSFLDQNECQNGGVGKRGANLNEEKGKKKIDINIKSGHVWERQCSAKCSI